MSKTCKHCKRDYHVPKCRYETSNYCSRLCAGLGRRVSLEHKKAVKKAYFSKNREKINKRCTEWRLANPEKRKQIKDKWRANNKERTNFLTRRYIYRRKNAAGHLSFEEEQYLRSQFTLCPYCNTNKPTTVDHVIPLSRGGSNDLDNLLYVCVSCNSKKGAKLLIEWNPLLFVQFNRLRN